MSKGRCAKKWGGCDRGGYPPLRSAIADLRDGLGGGGKRIEKDRPGWGVENCLRAQPRDPGRRVKYTPGMGARPLFPGTGGHLNNRGRGPGVGIWDGGRARCGALSAPWIRRGGPQRRLAVFYAMKRRNVARPSMAKLRAQTLSSTRHRRGRAFAALGQPISLLMITARTPIYSAIRI